MERAFNNNNIIINFVNHALSCATTLGYQHAKLLCYCLLLVKTTAQRWLLHTGFTGHMIEAQDCLINRIIFQENWLKVHTGNILSVSLKVSAVVSASTSSSNFGGLKLSP